MSWGLTAVALVVLVALLLFFSLDVGLRQRPIAPELTQQVSVTIEQVNLEANTIRVIGDLVGIMGTEIAVTPRTWIGIDGQLTEFGELHSGLRAKVAFVHQGQQKIARWISASSSQSSDVRPDRGRLVPGNAHRRPGGPPHRVRAAGRGDDLLRHARRRART